MTATAAAPDDHTRARWKQLHDRLIEVGRRTRLDTGTAVAALDDCLARLHALRQELAAGMTAPAGEFGPRHPACTDRLPAP